MKVNVDAPAKINLFLDIRGKRSDGYHIVSMVMQSISLCDEITVSRTDDGDIKIVCSDENIPLDETNTVYKAVELFFKETEKENKGIEIKIKKNIPTEAGLGGGSTDAAAVPQWTLPADGHRHIQSGSAWRLSHPPAPRHWNAQTQRSARNHGRYP